MFQIVRRRNEVDCLLGPNLSDFEQNLLVGNSECSTFQSIKDY